MPVKKRTKKPTAKNKKRAPKKAAKKKIIRRKSAAKKSVVKKRALKKVAKKRAVSKKTTPKAEVIQGQVIGEITHYFPKVRAAVIKLKATLTVGETIRVKGHTTDFTQNVQSIQIDRKPLETAGKGAEIGLLVGSRVRQGDTVYKI